MLPQAVASAVASRSWLTTLIYGVRTVFTNGALMPERNALNFVGATLTDDPVLKATTITIPAYALLAGATKNATPNTLVLRGASGEANFGGTCNLATLAASVAITSVDITASASCSADEMIATSSVTSPLFQGDSNTTFASAGQTAPSTNSGTVLLQTGAVVGVTSSSGPLGITTGAATQSSGFIAIRTGNAAGAGTVGELILGGGDHSGANDGGSISLDPGSGATEGSISLGSTTTIANFGGGGRVVWMAEASTNPSSAPATGGILYIDAADGSLHFFDRAGTDSILAPSAAQILVSASATISVTEPDHVVVATHASPTITLHVGATGDHHNIKYKGSGSATVATSGGQFFYDAAQQATITLGPGDAMAIVFDGTDWSIT